MRNLAISFIILASALTAFGQAPIQKPLRVGVGLLGSTYAGDLSTNGKTFTRFYPGMGFSLQFASDKLLHPQLNTGFGKFVAQDRDIPAVDGVQPNTYVETPFFYVDFRLRARFLRERMIVPFASVGLGLLGYTPKDQEGINLLDNIGSRKEEEVYGSISAGFPLSLGTEIRLSHFVSLALEYTFRPTTSDYLDNVGLLGARDGKDKIHSLLLSIFFTIDPERTINPNNMRGRDRR